MELSKQHSNRGNIISYHHFSTFERGCIQELLSLGYSHRAIAEKPCRHRSSIDREIHRNTSSTGYNGEEAQSVYDVQRKNSKANRKYTDNLIATIANKLLATWSPKQIANTITLGIVSFKTIYNCLYAGILPAITVGNLRQKGNCRKVEKRDKFSMKTPISETPKEVKSRAVFGHWELDSMASSCGGSKDCFATFVERKSRLYTALKTLDRTAASMQKAMTTLYDLITQRCFSELRTGARHLPAVPLFRNNCI